MEKERSNINTSIVLVIGQFVQVSLIFVKKQKLEGETKNRGAKSFPLNFPHQRGLNSGKFFPNPLKQIY